KLLVPAARVPAPPPPRRNRPRDAPGRVSSPSRRHAGPPPSESAAVGAQAKARTPTTPVTREGVVLPATAAAASRPAGAVARGDARIGDDGRAARRHSRGRSRSHCHAGVVGHGTVTAVHGVAACSVRRTQAVLRSPQT